MITQDTHVLMGYCPTCEERREADALDVLFDLKPSCGTCGEWLTEPFNAEPK